MPEYTINLGSGSAAANAIRNLADLESDEGTKAAVLSIASQLENQRARTAPKTSPAMGPEQQGRGGGDDAAALGLVIDREQGLGTCSPELLARLESIKASRLTAPEKFAVGLAIQAVIDHKPSEYMAGYLKAMDDLRREMRVIGDVGRNVIVAIRGEVWNELQEVR